MIRFPHWSAFVVGLALICTANLSLATRTRPLLDYGSDAWRHAGLGAIRGATIGPIERRDDDGSRGYGSPASEEVLDALRATGCTWISITPFGRMWDLHSVDIDLDFETPFSRNREKVVRFVQQAHARGMRVMLVPHLWIETGGWRGDLDPGTEERWASWFRSYTRFVLAWAAVAQQSQVDLFSIGVEMKSSSGSRPREWFALIDAVRDTYDGLLTYSANWGEEEQVLFWDRLDLVGINAFYPLTDKTNASLQDLRAGALARADALGAWAIRENRSVLFTEFGYTARPDPALRPWEWPDGMTNVHVDERAQANAYRALLEAFAPRRWFAGGFVWRYAADAHDTTQEPLWGFSPRGREAERVLEQIFSLGWGSDPFDPDMWRSIWH